MSKNNGVTYSIAFIDKSPEVYLKATEYFSQSKDSSNLKIVLTNISGLTRTEIESMHFHCLVYSTSAITEQHNCQALQNLLSSKSDPSDLKIFPLSNKHVTPDDEIAENRRLSSLVKPNQNPFHVIPISILNISDLISVLKSIKILALSYAEIAGAVISDRIEQLSITAERVLKIMTEKSAYTASHLLQVGIFASEIAKYMGYNDSDSKIMGLLGVLHDVGKLVIPKELLNSKHMLLPCQRQQISKHAHLDPLLIPSSICTQDELNGMEGHHNPLPEQNSIARIITVADCMDAMMSQRNYNNPKTVPAVFRDLMSNTHPKDTNIPAQFGREETIASIVMLANHLKFLGFDAEAMISATSINHDSVIDSELLDIIHNPLKYCPYVPTSADLHPSFSLNETAHFVFPNRQSPDDDIRNRSEYEFLIMHSCTSEQLAAAQSFPNLEDCFTSSQLRDFKQQAEQRIAIQDAEGRTAMEYGKLHSPSIPAQVVQAALGDISFGNQGTAFFNHVLQSPSTRKAIMR